MLSSVRRHMLLWRKRFKRRLLFFVATELMIENVCVLILEYMDVVRNRAVRLFNDFGLHILRGLTQFNLDIFNVKVFEQFLKVVFLFEILVIGSLRSLVLSIIVALLNWINMARESGGILAMVLRFIIDGGNYWLLINVVADFRNLWWIIRRVLLLDLRLSWCHFWFFRTHVR